MKIRVNGADLEIADGMTLQAYMADYVRQQGLDLTLYTVALNYCLQPYGQWDIPLAEGDNLEIIRFIGGG